MKQTFKNISALTFELFGKLKQNFENLEHGELWNLFNFEFYLPRIRRMSHVLYLLCYTVQSILDRFKIDSIGVKL